MFVILLRHKEVLNTCRCFNLLFDTVVLRLDDQKIEKVLIGFFFVIPDNTKYMSGLYEFWKIEVVTNFTDHPIFHMTHSINHSNQTNSFWFFASRNMILFVLIIFV